MLDEKGSAVEYELKKLVKSGLLETNQTDYKTFYFLNKKFPFYKEMLSIINKFSFYPELTKFVRKSKKR